MICSRLGEGIASNYSYAYTLEQFITATITATLSLILLSRYATYVSEGNTEMVVKTFKESLSGLLVLLVPITIVACVMSPEIVKIVYMRGKFDETAAYHTSQALIGFAVGFGLIAVREMYIRLHFAYQDTKMPMVANIAAVFLNAALSFLLAPYIGVLGVALATSLSVILTICLLNRSVKKYLPDFRFLAMRKLLIKLTVAGAATAATALTLQILRGYIAYRYYLYIEVKGLTCHWVVEVHSYSLLLNLADNTVHTVTLCVRHRDNIANKENILSNLAVNHKDILWELYHCLSDNLAVAICRLKGERYLIARLFAHQRTLELRKEHACATYELQWLALRIFICNLSVHGKCIVYRNHFTVFYFHNLIILKLLHYLACANITLLFGSAISTREFPAIVYL